MSPYEEAATRFSRQIEKAAEVFHARCEGRVPYEDIYTAALDAAALALESYRPDGGRKKHSWVAYKVKMALRTLIRGARRRCQPVEADTDEVREDGYRRASREWLRSVEAAEVKDLVARLPASVRWVVEGKLEDKTLAELAREKGLSKRRMETIWEKAVKAVGKLLA
jgi:hypothetical protein